MENVLMWVRGKSWELNWRQSRWYWQYDSMFFSQLVTRFVVYTVLYTLFRSMCYVRIFSAVRTVFKSLWYSCNCSFFARVCLKLLFFCFAFHMFEPLWFAFNGIYHPLEWNSYRRATQEWKSTWNRKCYCYCSLSQLFSLFYFQKTTSYEMHDSVWPLRHFTIAVICIFLCFSYVSPFLLSVLFLTMQLWQLFDKRKRDLPVFLFSEKFK